MLGVLASWVVTIASLRSVVMSLPLALCKHNNAQDETNFQNFLDFKTCWAPDDFKSSDT